MTAKAADLVIGFDVGGTKIGIGIGDTTGNILGMSRLPNIDTYPDEVLPKMASEVRRLVAEAGRKVSDFAAFGNTYPDTVIRPLADMTCIEDRYLVYPVERRLSGEAREFMDFSFRWLREHKHELFRWPSPYENMNDWYDLPAE